MCYSVESIRQPLLNVWAVSRIHLLLTVNSKWICFLKIISIKFRHQIKWHTHPTCGPRGQGKHREEYRHHQSRFVSDCTKMRLRLGRA